MNDGSALLIGSCNFMPTYHTCSNSLYMKSSQQTEFPGYKAFPLLKEVITSLGKMEFKLL
jgi:hypothetical protein